MFQANFHNFNSSYAIMSLVVETVGSVPKDTK